MTQTDIIEVYEAIDSFTPIDKKTIIAPFKGLTKEAIFTPQSHEIIVQIVKGEIDLFQGDISTEKGRKEIKDFAFKIAKIRNRIEDAKKEVTADWKERAKNVDTQARGIKNSLEELEELALKPLTDFNNAEKLRISEHEAKIADIEFYEKQKILNVETAQDYLKNLENARNRDWQEFSERAVRAYESSKLYLNEQIARLQEIARQQAELAELNRKAEEARQKEREEQIRREAAEKARKEAEANAEAEKQAILKAEQEKQAKAESERIAKEREAQAIIDAERKKAQEEKEALEKEIARQKSEAERVKREAEDKALKEKQESERIENLRLAREADLNHRRTINNQAVSDLIELGITKEQAVSIVTAIAKGTISNIKIEY